MSAFREGLEKVWTTMKEEADDEGLWTGSTTGLLDRLGIHRAHYTRIFGTLRDSGAMVQEFRGGGKGKSVWRILDPEIDLSSPEVRKTGFSTKRLGEFQDEIDTIKKELGGIDIKQAFSDLSFQIAELRGRIGRLESGRMSDDAETAVRSDN